MEQIENFMVLPNKLTIPFSPEVAMQVNFGFNLEVQVDFWFLHNHNFHSVPDFRFSNVLNWEEC